MALNADALDLKMWEEAKLSHIEPEPISWFFSNVLFTITVLDRKGVEVCRVSSRAFMELAVFDIMANFWESLPPAEKNGEVVTLTSYHELLRRSATDELLNQPQALTYTPSILHPWLKRTLCLLGHDESSRRIFETFNYPHYLLDDGAHYDWLAMVTVAEFIHSV